MYLDDLLVLQLKIWVVHSPLRDRQVGCWVLVLWLGPGLMMLCHYCCAGHQFHLTLFHWSLFEKPNQRPVWKAMAPDHRYYWRVPVPRPFGVEWPLSCSQNLSRWFWSRGWFCSCSVYDVAASPGVGYRLSLVHPIASSSAGIEAQNSIPTLCPAIGHRRWPEGRFHSTSVFALSSETMWHSINIFRVTDSSFIALCTCILTARVMEVTSGPRGLSTVSLERVKEHSLQRNKIQNNNDEIRFCWWHTPPCWAMRLFGVDYNYLGTQFGGVLSTSQAAKRLIGMSEGWLTSVLPALMTLLLVTVPRFVLSVISSSF